MTLRDLPALAFDLETTGVNPNEDRIVTYALILVDTDGALIAENHGIAQVAIDIPEAAAAVHGVTTERARAEGKPLPDVLASIMASLNTYPELPIIAFNARFDLTMLAAELLRENRPDDVQRLTRRHVIDPLILDKHLSHRKGKRQLGPVAEHYGITITDWHTAEADALAAARIAQAITKSYPSRLPATLQELHDQQIRWAAEQARRNGKPDAFVEPRWPIALDPATVYAGA